MAEPSITVEVFEGTGKNKVNYSYEKDLDGSLTLTQLFEDNADITYSVSQTVLKEEQAKGFDKRPRVRTDNRFGKPAVKVLPFGKIEYFAKLDVGPALLDMYAIVEDRAPHDTGQYKSGNYVFFNGQLVATKRSELALWIKAREKFGFKETDKIRLVNVNNYARKLEFLGVAKGTTGRNKGKNVTKGRKTLQRKGRGGEQISYLRRAGAYSLAERAAKRKYKSLASTLKFQWVPGGTEGVNIPDGGPKFRNKFTPRPGSNGKKGKIERPSIYPSFVIKFTSAGAIGVTGE